MTNIYPTLYKRDVTGRIREWCIEVDGSRYRTISGILDGNHSETPWTTAKPKNIGKANETTAEEQAILEVEAEYRKKLKQKYFDNINDVDETTYFSPMLAEKYQDYKDFVLSQSVVYSNIKYDGIRCVSKRDGLWTRKGEIFDSIPHVSKALKDVFEVYPHIVLDGELYNHDFRDHLNKINSLSKNIEKSHILQYHVYDVYVEDEPDLPYSLRMKFLELLHNLWDHNVVKPVPYVQIDNPSENVALLDDLFDSYRRNGYEGQIIRLDTPYLNKRTKNLIKRKEFIDAEFPILRIEEGIGTWAGFAKTVVCSLPDGREFGAGFKGDKAYAKEVLDNADKYKYATIRYFKESEFGVPLQGIAVLLHDGERDR